MDSGGGRATLGVAEQNIRLENHTRDRAQEQRSHRSEKESKCTQRERERCEYNFEDPDSAGFFFLLGL